VAAVDGLLKMGVQHAVDELRLQTDEAPAMSSRGAKIRLSIPPTDEAMLRHLLDGILTAELESELRLSGKCATSYTTKTGEAFSVAFEHVARSSNGLSFLAIFRRVAAEKPAAIRPPEEPKRPLRAVADKLTDLLREAAALGASDVHLLAGDVVTVRVDGVLRTLERQIGRIEDLFAGVLEPAVLESLSTGASIDHAYDLPEIGRFRLHLYRASQKVAAAIRVLPQKTPSLAELHLPVPLDDLAELRDGLVIVCGPTGAGKSATLAALAEAAVRHRQGLLVTLEDPVEYRITATRGLVRQRQIGIDVRDFPSGLRDALREDPDLILIGEMRDQETISLALTAAETGHLVLASLHSRSAAGSIERIIDAYAPERQQQIRSQLSESLRAVVSQRLCRRASGSGRIPAIELLRGNHTIANLIREGKTAQIATVLQSARKEGMFPLERCLTDLVRSGQITLAEATAAANSPTSLASYLQS